MSFPQRIRSVLGRVVELTEERWEHIRFEHPIMQDQLAKIRETLRSPDVIKRSNYDPEVVLFYKFYEMLEGGKHVTVVVKWSPKRSFVLTAYLTDRVKKGATIWPRN
ncbi:MAG: hypothetical protein NZ610_05735 [Candidatus Bipolaricaulota bacterium]|nr:hypothetical protein [Candidatus Bipolaricaulota bacterium]MCS7274882.1 hypothetical protein [Candidatus Bipolaricaulota bacterium]MDW8111161.1 hypothetical protein [Candidatus Bipolaricaulota bacterium]MDW8329579.1 hypothetical protein [Candidatus Bipolaricaulota bacterium]